MKERSSMDVLFATCHGAPFAAGRSSVRRKENEKKEEEENEKWEKRKGKNKLSFWGDIR